MSRSRRRYWGGREARSARTRSFTLVELLIVMVILATLAAVTLPYARASYRGLRLEDAARTLRARLAAARELALQEGRPVRLRIDRLGRRYQIEVATNVLGTEFGRAPGFVGRAVRLPDGVAWGQIVLADTDTDRILFDPQHTWPSGEIRLAGAAESYLVRCQRGTGRVRVFRVLRSGGLWPQERPKYEDLLHDPL